MQEHVQLKSVPTCYIQSTCRCFKSGKESNRLLNKILFASFLCSTVYRDNVQGSLPASAPVFLSGSLLFVS